MKNKQTMRYLLLFLFLSLNLFAVDGKIKVFVKSQDAIYTSQKVTVSVELLSDAFSITDAKIIFPASKKYIVQAPKSAAYLGQEEVEGEDWQMVHYEYEVYALQAGKIEIPAVSVSFTASMGYGQPKKEFVLKSDTLYFDVKAPEGVKSNQFVLVTDNYSLNSELKPDKKELIIGDAVALSITQKAQGVPDILLSPIVYASNAFLRVYEKEPSLESGLKGKYDVSRMDSFTFVASGEGNITLPAQETLWWNSDTKQIHTEKIPAISFVILPDPQIAIDAKAAEQKKLMMYGLLALVVLSILYIIFVPKIRYYKEERKIRYKESEAGKFALLSTCVELNDAPCIYKYIYIWLASIAPEMTRNGFKGIEDVEPSFADALKSLDLALVNRNTEFDNVEFAEALKEFRNKLLVQKEEIKEGLPKTINPL